MNYHDQKIRQTLARDIQKHKTVVSTLSDFISSAYCDRTSYYRTLSRNSTTDLVVHIIHKLSQINSSRGDHGIHCRWDQIRSKQLSCVSVYRGQMFTGFSGYGNSICNNKNYTKNEIMNAILWPKDAYIEFKSINRSIIKIIPYYMKFISIYKIKRTISFSWIIE